MDALRYDRCYLPWGGGELRVFFSSLKDSTQRYGIAGWDFDEFLL